MPDVLDEILDRLPPSTVTLLESNSKTKQYLSGVININNLLHNFQEIKSEQINKGLKRRIFDLKSKTNENENLVSKLKKEIQFLKSLKKTPSNEESIKAYTAKIKQLEAEAKNLTRDQGDINLVSLFNEVINLNQQIEDYTKKTTEEKKTFPFDEDFPLDIKQAEAAIEVVKQSIKQYDKCLYSNENIL